MKKIFGIMGTGLLLASNVLMSFSNVSFALQDIGGYDYYPEPNGCYVYADYVKPTKGVANSYLGTKLLAYKCDAEGGTVDLTKMPLEDGQYLVAVGPNAFSGTNVTKVIMPSTVESVGNGAFCNAEKVGTGCGNGIIESGEECDDGSEGSNYCTSQCEKTLCGDGKVDEGEDCFSCPQDVDPNGLNCVELLPASLDGDEDLEYKGEYREISASAGPVDNTNFVVIDFPDGMNDEFYIEDLDYACAKLQEHTVTFMTEDDEDLGTIETEYQRINPENIPQVLQKEGFIGAWYLGSEIFDVNSQITADVTLVYKYEKGGIEYDEENGWIKVSLGDQEIIVKDKNQGAEKTAGEVDESQVNDLLKAAGVYYFWGNNTGLDLSEIFGEDGLIKDDVDLPEGFDHGYLGMQGGDDWTSGSDDTPCDASKGEYLPSPSEWIKLMQIWGRLNGYELDHDNNGYYFDDMNVAYDEKKNVTKSLTLERAYGGMDTSITKFLNDLYIGFYPSLYIDNGGILFNGNMQFYPSSLSNGKIGYFTSNGLPVYDESNLYGFENDYATPVRCFLKPQFEVSFEVNGGTDVVTQKIFSGDKVVEPEVQKENFEFLGWFTEDGIKFDFTTPVTADIKLHAEWQEKKSNSSYSGGGGGGSSSSSNTSKTSDKLDNSAKEKVESSSEEDVKSTPEGKVDNYSQNNIADNNQKHNEDKNVVVSQKVTYVPDTNLSENEQAYNFAHTYGITNKTSVESAQMNTPLTRIQMAKILSQYAINVLGKIPDTSKNVKFKDVTDKKDVDYDNGVTLAYQLGIMGQNMKNGKFRPDDEVTRAEFVTALSRLLYSTSDGKYKSTSKYYTYHMEKLKEEGIITKDNPKMKEMRGYVMIMLMRSAK